jgi:hypothetical protein
MRLCWNKMNKELAGKLRRWNIFLFLFLFSWLANLPAPKLLMIEIFNFDDISASSRIKSNKKNTSEISLKVQLNIKILKRVQVPDFGEHFSIGVCFSIVLLSEISFLEISFYWKQIVNYEFPLLLKLQQVQIYIFVRIQLYFCYWLNIAMLNFLTLMISLLMSMLDVASLQWWHTKTIKNKVGNVLNIFVFGKTLRKTRANVNDDLKFETRWRKKKKWK